MEQEFGNEASRKWQKGQKPTFSLSSKGPDPKTPHLWGKVRAQEGGAQQEQEAGGGEEAREKESERKVSSSGQEEAGVWKGCSGVCGSRPLWSGNEAGETSRKMCRSHFLPQGR